MKPFLLINGIFVDCLSNTEMKRVPPCNILPTLVGRFKFLSEESAVAIESNFISKDRDVIMHHNLAAIRYFLWEIVRGEGVARQENAHDHCCIGV